MASPWAEHQAADHQYGYYTLANLPVTLNITGANTFNDTQMVPSLAGCGGQARVTFAPFTPGALGSNTVEVSVPAGDIAANNSLSKALNITGFDYSYKYPGSIATGGVGVNGSTGAFLGKFTITAAAAITNVKLEFAAASATTYRVAIYGDSGSGTPSTTALYVDAADRMVSVAGPVTITLPSPVAVGPGNFYVGIQQTNATNASLSSDSETPIRGGGAFFLAVPNPPASWSDFSPTINFKLNIGLVLQTPTRPTPTPTATSTATPMATATATATIAPTVTPTPMPGISGTVIYCTNTALNPIPGVTVTLAGTSGGSTTTDAAGNYSFTGLMFGGNYTVTPTKTALSPGSPNISTVDVIATQRHFLHLGPSLSGCGLTAADVNGDSSVNTVDVVAIQRFFLGFSTGIANTGKYQFTPVNRAYTGIVGNQTGQNYDTLVFGDVAAPFVEP